MATKAVLLDYDGTLIDSERVYLRLWNQILERHGVRLSEEQYGRYLLGYTNTKNAEDLIAMFAMAATVEQLVGDVEQAMHEHLRRSMMPLTERAAQAVAALAERGYRLAIVSSNRRPFILAGLEHHGLSSHFEAIVAREDAASHKPHPDPYLQAMRLLGVEPGDCIAVEDTLAGLQAACAAGVACLQFSGLFEQPHSLAGVRGSIRRLEQILEWLNR